MDIQFYIVGGSENLNASLSDSVIADGWSLVSDYTKAHLLILNLEPDPKKSINELWKIVLNLIENKSCIFDYIIIFSAISEYQLKFELERYLWNKLIFILKSCNHDFFYIFCERKISFSTLLDQVNIIPNKLNYIQRLSIAFSHSRDRGWKWATNDKAGINELVRIADDSDERLNNEHDTISVFEQSHNHGEILEKQSAIDYYYLLTSYNLAHKRKFTIACVDDFAEPFVKDLQLISQITGYNIYYTDSAESANKCIDSMRSPFPALGGTFNRVLFNETVENISTSDLIFYKGDQNDIVALKHRGNIPKLDWIYMDLMLQLPGFSSHQRFRLGDEALKRYMERSPEVPAILLTWSEEPDVTAEALRESQAVSVVSKRRILRLPYEMENYRHKQLGEVIDYLDDELSRRMIGAIRLWRAYPGILWHGEKTVHAAEHTLEHSLGLWKLANQLITTSWDHINSFREISTTLASYTTDDLFRFLMSIWLHDIGSKGSEAYQMADQVRDRHSWISGELLHRNPELYMLRRGEEADVVELICAYHQSCAPFYIKDKPKEVVKGLFHQSLEEIEEASGWKLMEWTALLRLLDAIEHNWRRVGNEQLYKSKKATIAIDAKFYREREKVSPDAKSYADWLESQDKHMRKHMSVLDVSIRTKVKGDELLFWPEYEFSSPGDAEQYLGEIGTYVLKEWYSSGKSIKNKMKMRLPNKNEIASKINETTFGISRFHEYIILERKIRNLKRLLEKEDSGRVDRKKEIEKLEKSQKKAAWEVWSGSKQS